MSEDRDKVKWTLDLIEKLKAANIGDTARLDAIKNSLENGRIVYDSDKKYLKEKFEQLNPSELKITEGIADNSKIEKQLYIIKKLQEVEIGNSEKLNSIKSLLENNKSLSLDDSNYLAEKYQQLQKVDDYEGKIGKALEAIRQLKQEEIGNSNRLDSIKKVIDERGVLSSEDDSYLAEKFRQLKKIKGSEIPKKTPQQPSSPEYRGRPLEWKSEGVTLVLSIVLGLIGLQGTGHIYVGQVGKGIAILIISLILFGVGIATVYFGVGVVLLIIYFIIFIWQILDSRSRCMEFNDYLEKHGKRPW